MTKREKKVVLSGVTREQMETAMSEYAIADAAMVQINARLDEQFTRLREAQADRLAELSAQKNKSFDVVQVYATENRDTLFAKRKSIENSHGVFGFRVGMPQLKQLKGFTWAAVLDLAKEFAPQFTRSTVELAKDKLLAERDNKGVDEVLDKIRVRVVQDETFFVELKKETTHEQTSTI